jgi:hypothetical protein
MKTITLNSTDKELNLPATLQKALRAKKLNRVEFYQKLDEHLRAKYPNTVQGQLVAFAALIGRDMLDRNMKCNSWNSFIEGMTAIGYEVNISMTTI